MVPKYSMVCLTLVIACSTITVLSQKVLLGLASGQSTFDPTSFVVHLGAEISDNGILRLSSTTNSSGIAIYTPSVYPAAGFTTSFVWNTSDCSTSTNLLSSSNFADGWVNYKVKSVFKLKQQIWVFHYKSETIRRYDYIIWIIFGN